MNIKEMTKVVEKFTLRDPIALDELHGLMQQNAAKFPGNFILKKGLFGPYIVFDTLMTVQPRVKSKDNKVTVRKVNITKRVGARGMSIDIKATQQRIQAAQEGGLSKAVTGGQEYFLEVIEVMRELLQNRM